MIDQVNGLGIEVLNTNCPFDVECYERAFYTAYERASHNRLIRKLWNWNDDQRRLSVRLPYLQQINYVMRKIDSGEIVTGLAVNRDCTTCQSRAYGFYPVENNETTCEFLTLFSVNEHNLHSRFAFWRTVFCDLYERGYRTAYATTASKVLRFYSRMGAEVLEQRMIDDEERYFLRFDTRCTTWKTTHSIYQN